MPTVRLAATKSSATKVNSADVPEEGNVKDKSRRQQDDGRLDESDPNIRNQLAGHDLDRSGGHSQQVFHGAALALASDRETRSSSPS